MSSEHSKKLSLAVSMAFLAAVYCGLAMLFYTPEQGFSWIINFVLLTVAVLGIIVLLVFLAGKSHRNKETELTD